MADGCLQEKLKYSAELYFMILVDLKVAYSVFQGITTIHALFFEKGLYMFPDQLSNHLMTFSIWVDAIR